MSSRRSGPPSIWVCSATEDQCDQVSEEPGFDAKWSPEGNRLVYTSVGWDLFGIDINGGFTRRLMSDDFLDATPSWSGDGKWIYFTSDRTGERQIWKMPAEGGELVQLTRGGGGSPRESYDGRFIYYMKPLGKFERMAGNPHHIWSVPVDGGEEQPVFDLMKIFAGGNITLWRDSFVFLDRDDDTGDRIFQFDIPTENLEEIAYLGHGGAYCLGCNVSPDGRWILLAKRDERQSADIFVVDKFH
jgi:Tol biopolymer transport system component